MSFSTIILFAAAFAQNATSPEFVGNCLSQKIDFTARERVYSMFGEPSMGYIAGLDTSRYDMTIDYATDQVEFVKGGGVKMTILKSKDASVDAMGPRLSTTRFVLYGKFSAMLSAPATKGVITTFVGMGPHLPDANLNLAGTDPASGDEIDWEIVGGDALRAQSNLFYRGFKDFGVRGEFHNVSIVEKNKYTIDWKRESITWSVNDQVVRVYNKNDPKAATTRAQDPSGRARFFPDRAMKIQFALWSDRGAPEFDATGKASATYDWVDIQCYDDQDLPVPMFPLTNNPAKRDSIPNQPTQNVNSKIPVTASPGYKGAIKPDGTSAGNAPFQSLVQSFIAAAALLAIF